MDVPEGRWKADDEGMIDIIVSSEVPGRPDDSTLIYQAMNSSGDINHIKITYEPFLGTYAYGNPSLLQKLFNAKEIAKELDARACERAYREAQEKERQARIDENTKKLTELYG